MKTIIHDLNKADFSAFELPDENVVVFTADGQYAPCSGCFACWLKNTGFCVMDDSLKHAGAWIGQSDPLIIISRLCYGGYSPGVKAVLDRAIGVSNRLNLGYKTAETLFFQNPAQIRGAIS